jgi:hypothetical protein
MKKCAVIIGVNKTGGLPELFAAVKGANDFKNWAEKQGFETVLLTDEDGKKVTVKEITNAVKGFVDKQTYSQMVVFFSGHGILKSATDEQWLLSEAPAYANETVSVLASRMLARRSGIPHIIFISDACRSIPNDPLVTEVIGSVIFPNVAQTGDTDIDILYSTIPGNPSYEVKEDVAVANFRGIYTECLLKALRGDVTEVIEDLKVGSETILTIPVYELHKYLQTAVPLAASRVDIMLSQVPDGEITSRLPKYLARVEREKKPVIDTGAGKEILLPKAIEPVVLNSKNNNYKLNLPDFDFFKSSSIENTQTENERVFSNLGDLVTGLSQTRVDVANNMDALKNASGRNSFETRTGFSITGTNKVQCLMAAENGFDQFEEEDQTHIRILEQNLSRTLFLQLESGNVVPLAILPGFIGTVVVENGAVINVNYVPSQHTPKYELMRGLQNEDFEHRRALVATAARFGSFKVEGDVGYVIEQASYLRNIKAIDPTMGLYAAYAYMQAGSYTDLKSVYEYMWREPEPVLYDVWMLVKISKQAFEAPKQSPAPFCPMLTQGWSYMSVDNTLFAPELQELGKYLVPGLWTTFNPKGVELIRHLINTHQIL